MKFSPRPARPADVPSPTPCPFWSPKRPSETTTPPKSATADDAARTMACTLPAQRYTEVSQRSVTQGHLSEIGRCEVKSASITDSGQHRASIHHVRWVQ